MATCTCGHTHRDHAIEHTTDEPCIACSCMRYEPEWLAEERRQKQGEKTAFWGRRRR